MDTHDISLYSSAGSVLLIMINCVKETSGFIHPVKFNMECSSLPILLEFEDAICNYEDVLNTK